MTHAEHRAEADRLVSLCYTSEPIDPDEVLPDITISGGERYANMLAAAQVHATLALAPQQPAQAPQQRMDPAALHSWMDATGARLACWPTTHGAFIGNDEADDAWLIEDTATLRALASLLTAHADRLESKP